MVIMIENPSEWFQNKTFELTNDSKKKSVLLDMKSVVLNSDKKVLNDIVRNVSINPVFECLTTSDDQETVELICVILLELLGELRADELLERYGGAIHQSLLNKSCEVQGTILKLLDKTINQDAVEYLLQNHIPMLVDAVGCLASSERSTAQGAISMFVKIGSNTHGLDVLYSNQILKKLKEVMLVSDTARFRVYEIVVAVSKVSAENLSASVSSGLMQSLTSEVSSDDILVQLNSLEMLSGLATSNHGLTYLQEHKIIQNLVDKVLKLNEEPLSVILLPGLIEFFGNLCILQPDHFSEKYPEVMNLLFNSLDTTDEILMGVIITTVGKIGSTPGGRHTLNNYEGPVKCFFKRIGHFLTLKNDLTVTAMNSISELVKDINGDASLNEVSKKWFESIPNALDSIVNLSKLPFVEFRLSALALMKSIATQQWGTEKLSDFPGMIEFLTDRSTESNKDCKQIKFEIVFNMTKCSNIGQVVSEQVLLNLKEFVKEGPFYVPVQVEMATEGAE